MSLKSPSAGLSGRAASAGVLRGGHVANTHLLGPFSFTTTQAAPLPSPYTEPGANGSMDVVDTGTKASTTGGKLRLNGVQIAFADPRLDDHIARLRTPGRLLSATIHAAGQGQVGFGTSVGTDAGEAGFMVNSSNLYVCDTADQIGPLAPLTANTDYHLSILLRSLGVMLWIQGGSQYPTPRLFWVGGNAQGINLLKARINAGNGATVTDWDDVVMDDYAGVWGTHTPNATTVSPSPAAGQAVVMPADGIMEISYRALTAEVLDLAVRYVDDANRIAVRFTVATSTISIVSIVAGVETSLASQATTAGSVVDGNWLRIVVRWSAARIDAQVRVLSGTANRMITTSSATANQTTAAGKIISGTALYGLAVWPQDLAPPATIASAAPLHVLAIGDSKTGGSNDSTVVPTTLKAGYIYWLATTMEAERGSGVYDWRIAHSGYTVAQLKAAIDADLAATTITPVAVLLNIGVNDAAGTMPAQATWQTNYGYILDAIHTKWPSAAVLVTNVWGQTAPISANCDTIDDVWLPPVLAARAWAAVGADERIVLPGLMSDNLHPTTAGHQALAVAYKMAAGL